tara:strand:+ start:690 stop:920 length:231 start_codon:yes stop_codon:yes gene_type:complete
MVKITQEPQVMVELIRGKKIITRTKSNYDENKDHYTIRGFKLNTSNPAKKVFDKVADVVSLKPKRKKNVKKTKKKN